MPQTANYGLPYSGPDDPPNGPAQQQALAEATDTALGTVETNLDGRLSPLEVNAGGEWEASNPPSELSVGLTTIDWWDTELITPSGISLSGSQFTLLESGVWTIDASIQLANTPASGGFFLFVGDSSTAWAKSGGNGVWAAHVSVTRRFPVSNLWFNVKVYVGNSPQPVSTSDMNPQVHAHWVRP